ncbi:cold-shock protein [Mycobacterium persicum]|uniref:Cold shock protein A n=2 Tax=Mycobacterium persicum TaxID=1487726 RepID=A0AB38UU90_9MYCO|nr:cold shock domain-containing protein [Mycobacterium persicum]KZS83216.1 hypothetical protein A4G31_01640 [Mycobacterium persicum]VAZ76285.1 putative cold shock protein A [Mycobacterium persicum]VAZ84165.1 putative cold shock protein A [Mycobacterium persicum]VAZ94783.1 putative cold shock protein A [Mycobacterium persicum]
MSDSTDGNEGKAVTMPVINSYDVEAMLDSMATVSYGVINWFDDERGFGFVHPADGDRDVFIDSSEIVDWPAGGVHEGQHVSYQTGGTRHWPLAQAVHIL